MTPLVLASASPRRKALLEALGIELIVQPSGADEHAAGDAVYVATRNAETKRDEVVASLDREAVVIAADTVVVLDHAVLGKPVDLDEARAMLAALSDRAHEVVTGVAITDRNTGQRVSGAEVTRVTFRSLDAALIEAFVDTVRPLDRAGAYTVDGPGTLLVAGYEGCYTNVLGLPIPRLESLMQEIGDSLLPRMKAESAKFL